MTDHTSPDDQAAPAAPVGTADVATETPAAAAAPASASEATRALPETAVAPASGASEDANPTTPPMAAHADAPTGASRTARQLARAARERLLAGLEDAGRAERAEAAARRLAAASAAAAKAGRADIAEGVKLLDTAEQVKTLSDAVRQLSEREELVGRDLAVIAGELQAVAQVIEQVGLPSLAQLIAGRSDRLNELAVAQFRGAGSTRALAGSLEAAGSTVGALGTRELAEGAAHLAAAEAEAAKSAQSEAASAALAAKASAELTQAQKLRAELAE